MKLLLNDIIYGKYSEAYRKYFFVTKEKRKTLKDKIENVHKLILDYKGFKNSFYLESYYEDYRYSRGGLCWPHNIFKIAEEIILNSESAQKIEEIDLAAISKIKSEQTSYAAGGAVPGIEQPEDWEKIENWSSSFINAFLATTGLEPTDEVYNPEKSKDGPYKKANWLFSKYASYKQNIYTRTDVLQNFIDMYWKITGEADKKESEVYDFLKSYGEIQSFDVYDKLEKKRRKSFGLI